MLDDSFQGHAWTQARGSRTTGAFLLRTCLAPSPARQHRRDDGCQPRHRCTCAWAGEEGREEGLGRGEQGRASAQCGGAPPASGPSRSPAAGAPVPVRMPCQRGCHHISECMRQSQHLRRWGKAGRGPELGPEEGLGAGGALHAQQALPLQPQSSSRLVVVPGQAGRRTRVRVEAPVCCFSYFSWEGACSR